MTYMPPIIDAIEPAEYTDEVINRPVEDPNRIHPAETFDQRLDRIEELLSDLESHYLAD